MAQISRRDALIRGTKKEVSENQRDLGSSITQVVCQHLFMRFITDSGNVITRQSRPPRMKRR
jgi:hypothetical protein